MLAIRHPEVAGGPVVEGNATILKGQLEGLTSNKTQIRSAGITETRKRAGNSERDT